MDIKNKIIKETIEQAARNYFMRCQLGFEKTSDTEEAFIKGAKWQQQNSYSEEEVYSLLLKAIEDCYDEQLEHHYAGDYKNLKEWFKQNK